MHEYCIDWKEDTLDWSIDGKVQRTLQRKDTWNATANRFDYPQTPARVMLSLWPAGLPTNAKGTIDWAGGEIDWNSPYMQNGYYYARFQEVSVQCYDPPSTAQVKGSKTYKYTDKAGTNNTVAITDDIVVLGSLRGTGENPGKPSQSSTSSASDIAMVPGGNPGAGGGNSVQQTSAAAANNNDGAQAQPTSPGGSTNSGSGFVQGGSNAGSSAAPSLEPLIGGSVFAMFIAIMGLVAL